MEERKKAEERKAEERKAEEKKATKEKKTTEEKKATKEKKAEEKTKERAEGKQPVRTGRAPWLAVLVLAALCVCGWLYYRSTPLQRQLRMLARADSLLEAGDYEEAAGAYADARLLESPGDRGQEAADRARQGQLQALFLEADSRAAEPDAAARAQACDLYRQVIALCDEAGDAEDRRQEAAEKLDGLQEEIAASFDSVTCVTQRDDRSGQLPLPDGGQAAYTRYYDLVQVAEEYYPYADRINEVLAQDRNAFFADAADDSFGSGPEAEGARHYVGEAGIYSGNGLLSIRLAEVRVRGHARSVRFRGRTFRLSDGGEVTLGELTGRTDTGIRRLVRRRTASFLDEQGYRTISTAEIEDYVAKTAPEDFRFCIRNDGELCLVIDQEVPFFRGADHVLEIPLEK